MSSNKKCSVDGCTRAHYGKGYCTLHYTRMRRHGSTERPPRKQDLHGEYSCYYAGCRCEECVTAAAEKRRATRTERAGLTLLSPDDPRHGSATAFDYWQCRCEPCRDYARNRSRSQGKRVQGGSRVGRAHAFNSNCPCRNCRKQALRAERVRNDESRTAAAHHREEWTGPQLAIAARSDLTRSEAAAMLGRTLSSVTSMRKKIYSDPVKARLADQGLPIENISAPGVINIAPRYDT